MDADGIGSIAAAVVAAAALGVAFWARGDSKRSADASVRSADASDRSAVAAERAAEITDLEARRRVERSDVAWEQVAELEDGLLRYRNVGSHTAHDVTVVLTVNDERTTMSLGRVLPGEYLEHDAQDVHRAESRIATDKMRNSPPGVFLMHSTRFDVTARISWQSELGTPGIVTL